MPGQDRAEPIGTPQAAGADARPVEPRPSTLRTLLRFAPLALLAAAMVAVFATGTHRYISLETIATHRERLQAYVDAHQIRALALYMLVYVAVVSLSIPGAVILTISGGFLFGWLVGGSAAAVAATIGAIVIFSIARTSIGDVLLRRAGPRLQGLAQGFRDDGFSYLLFLRVLPLVPFWVTNLAAALFGVRLRTFALATQIGIIPATLTFAAAGAGLDSVIAAQQQAQRACQATGRENCALDLDLGTLITPQLLAALAALGLLSLVPVVLRRWTGAPTGRRSGGPPESGPGKP